MNFSTCQTTEGGRKSSTRRTENQDRILIRKLPVGDGAGFLLVVADGVSQTSNGGSVANWLVEKHLKEDAIEFPSDRVPVLSMKDFLENL